MLFLSTTRETSISLKWYFHSIIHIAHVLLLHIPKRSVSRPRARWNDAIASFVGVSLDDSLHWIGLTRSTTTLGATWRRWLMSFWLIEYMFINLMFLEQTLIFSYVYKCFLNCICLRAFAIAFGNMQEQVSFRRFCIWFTASHSSSLVYCMDQTFVFDQDFAFAFSTQHRISRQWASNYQPELRYW